MDGLGFGFVFGFVAGIVDVLAFGLLDVVGDGWFAGFGFAFVFGTVDVLAGGLVGVLVASSWLKQTPGFAKLARRPTSLFRLIKRGLGFGLVVGLVVGLVMTPLGVSGAGLAAGLLSGLQYGLSGVLGGGLMIGLIHWVETPTPADQVSTPLMSWRADRSLNLLKSLAGALAVGLAFGLGGLLTDGRAIALAIGLGFGLAVGLVGGLVPGRHHAWLVYVVATRQLASRRLLPRQLMPFLDDMHRLGLLRAVGPIYQFRHAELQDHLAETYRASQERRQRQLIP